MRDDGRAGLEGKVRNGEVRSRRRLHRDVAAILAVLVPGLGHVYVGRLRAGAIWFLAVVLGYWAILLPGVLLHAISIWSADRITAATAVREDR